MDAVWPISVDSKEFLLFEETVNEQLRIKETDDFCRPELSEIVPLARDTDGSCTTEYVSGDWSAEIKQGMLAVVKQEPDDVYWIIIIIIIINAVYYMCMYTLPWAAIPLPQKLHIPFRRSSPSFNTLF